MSDENEDVGALKVVDKRRFNDEGDARNDVETEPSKEQISSKVEAKTEPKPAGNSAYEESQTQVTFASFLVSLATQAMYLLGEIPHPETNEAEVNLEAAQQTIDILVLLEEKTQGNLSADEEKLLTEMVASLQLAFVNKLKTHK